MDSGALTIYATSSLEDVFRELAPDADFTFGNSEALAAALREGAPANVFAAASPEHMADLRQNALIDPPVAFATNRLVLVVPAGNPAGVESVEDVAGLDFVSGAELDVAEAALESIGEGDVLEGVDWLPGAAEQVASGNLDAALVYVTDAQAEGDAVEVIELPVQALVEYPISATTRSENYEEAEAFIALVLGEQGRQALEDAGFGVPPAG